MVVKDLLERVATHARNTPVVLQARGRDVPARYVRKEAGVGKGRVLLDLAVDVDDGEASFRFRSGDEAEVLVEGRLERLAGSFYWLHVRRSREERRRWERAALAPATRLPVVLDEGRWRGDVVDVSSGGARVRPHGDVVLVTGASVLLDFTVPGGRRHRHASTFLGAAGRDLRFAFTGVGLRDLADLGAFVARQAARR